MSGAATLREVAERAGVHPGTASRALNPETRHMVSAKTARRVLEAAAALSYRPNPLARGLKTSRTMTVGILVPDLANMLFAPMVRAAEDVLAAAGYVGLIADTANDPQQEIERLQALRAHHVDGYLIAVAQRSDPVLHEIAESDTPAVLINRRDDEARLPMVLGEDEYGVAAAMQHLVDLGHREIAHLAGPRTFSTGHARARAYRAALLDLGLEVKPELFVESRDFSLGAGREAAETLLAQAHPTAVLAGNDHIALGMIDAARARGLDVPGDLSVVGFNDIPMMDRLDPPLTSVHVPSAAMGAEAARILLRQMAGGERERIMVSFPVELKVRGSTAPPRSRA